MDDCSTKFISEFSYAKAFTCIAMKISSRQFRDKFTVEKDPAKIAQLNSMIELSKGKMAACPGGVVIKNS